MFVAAHSGELSGPTMAYIGFVTLIWYESASGALYNPMWHIFDQSHPFMTNDSP